MRAKNSRLKLLEATRKSEAAQHLGMMSQLGTNFDLVEASSKEVRYSILESPLRELNSFYLPSPRQTVKVTPGP